MSHVGRGDGPDELQIRQRPHSLEQPLSPTQQNRHQVDFHLVHEARDQVLLRRAGAAGHQHVFRARGLLRLLERRTRPLGHEVKRGSALHDERLAHVMGEDEYGMMVGRIASPPALPGVGSFPGTGMAAEHVAAHDGRSQAGHGFLDYAVAVVVLASGEAVHRLPRRERKHPLVQPLAAHAERFLHALIGPGDVAVERHRDLKAQLAHGVTPSSLAASSMINVCPLRAIQLPAATSAASTRPVNTGSRQLLRSPNIPGLAATASMTLAGGQISMTETPRSASSTAMSEVSRCRAALPTEYGRTTRDFGDLGVVALLEATFTMSPPPCAIMGGTA